MAAIPVGALSFNFDDDWLVSQYDGWSFYQHRFKRIRNEVKAVDVLAIAPDRTIWFIEAKDYRRHQRTKPIDLADEVAHKVFDTLAALLPARVNGDVLEQPVTHSKLFPRAIDPANVLMKKQLVKPIDAHPLVVEMNHMASLAWTVTSRGSRSQS